MFKTLELKQNIPFISEQPNISILGFCQFSISAQEKWVRYSLLYNTAQAIHCAIHCTIVRSFGRVGCGTVWRWQVSGRLQVGSLGEHRP